MKKIAIVDDEKDILDVLGRFLKRSDKFDVDTFQNPAVALPKVLSDGYDLILLDIMMPQMDGINFLEKVKKTNKSIKVIMMTAYSTLDKTIQCDKLGADDYVTKPFVSLRDVENKIFDNLDI